jgi:hypothetical protein
LALIVSDRLHVPTGFTTGEHIGLDLNVWNVIGVASDLKSVSPPVLVEIGVLSHVAQRMRCDAVCVLGRGQDRYKQNDLERERMKGICCPRVKCLLNYR